MSRRFFCQLLAALTFSLALPAAADDGYRALAQPQTPEDPGRIEVIEFFYYSCPHCNNMHRPLASWVGKLPADVNFRRVPVVFNSSALGNLAKLYYTLEITGDLARLDSDVFQALSQRINLADERKLIEWLAGKGVNTDKFKEIYNSFSVQTRVKRGENLAQAMQIDAVPTMVVDGRYRVNSAAPQEMLMVADKLIAKVRAERGKKK